MGLSDGLIRLSCGVEDVDDLLADLEQAFEGMPGSGKTKTASTKSRSRDTIGTGAP